MSVALLGKQTVKGTLIPIDNTGAPIDLTKFPVDQVIQPGTLQVSSGDLALYNIVVDTDPSAVLGVIVMSTGDVAGSAAATFIARNVNGDIISGTDDVSVTLPETTTTTTQAPETAPLAVEFQVNWGTPQDTV